MTSTKEYLDFVLEQLSELEAVSSRAMIGEYILYYRGDGRSLNENDRKGSSSLETTVVLARTKCESRTSFKPDDQSR